MGTHTDAADIKVQCSHIANLHRAGYEGLVLAVQARGHGGRPRSLSSQMHEKAAASAAPVVAVCG